MSLLSLHLILIQCTYVSSHCNKRTYYLLLIITLTWILESFSLATYHQDGPNESSIEAGVLDCIIRCTLKNSFNHMAEEWNLNQPRKVLTRSLSIMFSHTDRGKCESSKKTFSLTQPQHCWNNQALPGRENWNLHRPVLLVLYYRIVWLGVHFKNNFITCL